MDADSALTPGAGTITLAIGCYLGAMLMAGLLAAFHRLGALVRGVCRGEACGEGEGFEAGGGGVAGPVFQRGAHAQCPEFVEAAVQDAEGGVVGAGDGHDGLVWPDLN